MSRPRELTHDASLYDAYLRAEERLREEGADIRRVVLENDLSACEASQLFSYDLLQDVAVEGQVGDDLVQFAVFVAEGAQLA